MNKKIVGAAVVIIAIFGIALGWYMFVYSKNSGSSQVATDTLDLKKSETASLITPSQYEGEEPAGNAEDIVSEITNQLQTEQNNFITEEGEASASLIDQSSLDDFGQSYDENEF